MTVHVNQFSPSAPVGPGLALQLDSDIATFPSPATWRITFALLPGGASPFATFQVPNAFNFQQVFPYTHQSGMTQTGAFQQNYESGQSIHLQAELLNSVGTQVDVNNTSLTQPFDATLGLGQQAIDLAGSGGGLTTDQATQLANADTQSAQMLTNWSDYTTVTLPSLQDVLNGITAGITTTIMAGGSAVSATLGALFSPTLLQSLGTVNISGGETCSQVTATLVGAPYGLIVRATTIPEWWVFSAPGESWSPQDLAVVQFIRGGDLLSRSALHTKTHLFYPLPGNLFPALTAVEIPLLPPDYHVIVDWGPGVCGEVLGLQAP